MDNLNNKTRKRILQDLLSSDGWKLFVSILLDNTQDDSKSFKSKIQDRLNASARSCEWDKVSYYTGQLDLIDVIIKLPEKEYNRT